MCLLSGRRTKTNVEVYKIQVTWATAVHGVWKYTNHTSRRIPHLLCHGHYSQSYALGYVPYPQQDLVPQ